MMPTSSAEAPRGPFGKRSTAEQVTRGLDLSGRTALVTGCTSGIGLETMRVLALRGAHVLGVGRTQAKAAAAWAEVRSPDVRGAVTPLGCEQADFGSVVACADAVRSMKLPLDIVVCNAGIVGPTTLELVNGVEKQFAVNHLSHFILVTRLLDLVTSASQGRVVMVSSDAYASAPPQGIDFENLNGARGYSAFRFYGQSKLANHLMTRELARRCAGTHATANSVHPGVVNTGVFRNLPRLARVSLQVLGRLFMKNPQAGAATTCYVATNPGLAGVSGCYFVDCNPKTPGPRMLDDALAAKLWAVSENLTRSFVGD